MEVVEAILAAVAAAAFKFKKQEKMFPIMIGNIFSCFLKLLLLGTGHANATATTATGDIGDLETAHLTR